MHRRSLLVAVTLGLPARAWTVDALPSRFDPRRDAALDLQQALALARAGGKRVLVDVGGEWCTWCHVLERFIAAHPQVQRALQAQYVRVKVNYSPQNRNEAVLARWPKPAGYPHFYVLDAGGELLVSQASGEFESGKDYDDARLLAFLQRHAGAPAR